jgi:uncharacterized protein
VPAYSHPGIYIEEVPGARSIQGAPTSIAAFVGTTESGPVAQPTLITSWNAFLRQFGRPAWYSFTPWAVYEFFREGGSSCYIVRVQDTEGKAASATLDGTKLNAASAGAWGNNLSVHVYNNAGDPAAASPVFNLQVVVDATVIDAPAGTHEDFSSPPLPAQLLIAFIRQNGIATTSVGGKPYYVLETFTGFTEAGLAFAQKINSNSMFIRVASSDGKRSSNTDSPKALTGGVNPAIDLVNAVETLTTVQGLSLLAVPETVTLTDADGTTDPTQQSTVINQGLIFCEGLGSLFYVTDPPYGMDVQTVQDFVTGNGGDGNAAQALNSAYGAIYYPWIWIFNPITGVSLPIPPSGPVLGRYARTDLNVGVFKSPAGVNDGAMKSVVAVDLPLSDSDQDNLNPYGINAVRNLINYGNVIWGARTLSQDTDWTYVSVRRLFIYVEQSLKNGLRWVVFESNDQTLWSSVDRDVSAFLRVLWQQGGLFGDTAEDAYFVTCDETNNPPETRALGQLFIDIGLAAVRPAELVIIRITQKTAGPDSGP